MTSPAPLAVIVPARNEARTIGACLASVRAQGWPERLIDIIVIDDGSTDETAAIARAHGARVIRTEGVGPSEGRNRAAALTDAPYCFFTDADCELEPGCLAQLAAAIDAAGPDVASVGGRQMAPCGASAYARQVQRFLEAFGFVSEYGRSEDGTGTGATGRAFRTSHNPSCCALLRREALLRVGGFRQDLWPCEDLELDMRLGWAGYRLLYVPSAVVRHHRPETPAAFRRMMRNYGRGHAHLVRLHGPRRLMHLLPLLSVATGGLVPLAAVAASPAWLAFRLRHEPAALAEVPALSTMLAQALATWHLGFAEGMAGRSAIERRPAAEAECAADRDE